MTISVILLILVIFFIFGYAHAFLKSYFSFYEETKKEILDIKTDIEEIYLLIKNKK